MKLGSFETAENRGINTKRKLLLIRAVVEISEQVVTRARSGRAEIVTLVLTRAETRVTGEVGMRATSELANREKAAT